MGLRLIGATPQQALRVIENRLHVQIGDSPAHFIRNQFNWRRITMVAHKQRFWRIMRTFGFKMQCGVATAPVSQILWGSVPARGWAATGGNLFEIQRFNTMARAPAYYDGPFMAQAVGMTRRAQGNLRAGNRKRTHFQRSLVFKIGIFCEPRHAIILGQTVLTVTRAQTNTNKSLLLTPPGTRGRFLPPAAGDAFPTRAALAYVDGQGTMMSSFAARWTCLVAMRVTHWTIHHVLTRKKISRHFGDLSITFHGMKNNAGGYAAILSFRNRRGAQTLLTPQAMGIDDRPRHLLGGQSRYISRNALLADGSGTAYATAFINASGGATRQRVQIIFHPFVHPFQKAPPGAPVRLLLAIPSRFRIITLPIKFRKLRLP